MNVGDAAYVTGQDYPGGARALALRLDRPSLSDELNPNRPTYKLGLDTAVKVQMVSGDFRILYAMALECRHFPPLPMPDEQESGEPCLAALAEVAREFSVLMQEVTGDLADGRIKDAEMRRVERCWNRLMQTGQHMLHQLGALNALEHRPGGHP